MEFIIKNYHKQYCIVGLDSLTMNIDKITCLYKNPKNDFFLIENKCDYKQLNNILYKYGFYTFKCHILTDEPPEVLIDYFMTNRKSYKNYEIINNFIHKPKYNTDLEQRPDVINFVSTPDDKYLEIGVEYGYTFCDVYMKNKIGVDPLPYFESEDLVIKTSDDYFEKLESHIKFDIIFIDGLHQCEQVAKDLNNSIRHLNKNGKILLDDIIPLNHHEQLKIPIYHEYKNGVLEALISWTGDVWKILYHVLLVYSQYIEFNYFNNLLYRGMAVLQIKAPFQIPETELAIINNYNYENDFAMYINLIENFKEIHAKKI